MIFRFGKIDGERFAPYVEGLEPHLAAFPNIARVLESKTVKYLAIEDFETHGLRGSFDPRADISSDYVAFWHRYGASGKSRQSGGRHGLGKSRIASASKLRMFFGATVRSDCKQRQLLLQGQIALGQHTVRDVADFVYDAYGLWYDAAPSGEKIPFIDKAALGFVHDFDLTRGRAPGLSLVIPFPDDDLTPDALVSAVIENSFHQIIDGKLVVHVDETIINAKTIRNLAERRGLTALKAAMGLSAEVATKKFEYFEPRADAVKSRLMSAHFSDKDLGTMRKSWVEGETIAVRLPLSIRKKGAAQAQQGEIYLYIRREQNPDFARVTCVRGRVTIPRKMLAGANCVGLLVADAGIASTFLGDAEPPSHDRWLFSRVKPTYARPEEALRRVLNAMADLQQILEAHENEQAFKNAFTQYLWIVKPDGDSDDDRPRRPRAKGPAVPLPIPLPQPHRLQRIDGGFAYLYRPVDEVDADAARIVVRYRRRTRGKTAKSALKFRDFDEPLSVDESGSAELEREIEPRSAVFKLANVRPGYELRVTGFDSKRDLELRLEAVSA
ncbi:hypothetical protein [Candidatus Binatus sp.]|uniref:hypothetical protein n=1 Tax=Candidatus Binatus sp. TaxID=2811406 RepID=UPI003CC5EC51